MGYILLHPPPAADVLSVFYTPPCCQDSELVCGVLDKAWLGDGQKNGLFAILLRDAGCAAAARCISPISP